MSVSPAAMRRLMKEIGELQRSPPEGIRVQTSEDNMLDLIGIIQGPEGTPYAGGYFRVKFRFTEEFPAAPPKCSMLTKIFHPNVSSAGEICVNTLKKDWKATYGIGHILVTIKCLLIYPNPESALDEEAGKLLLENYKSYCDRAKLITSVHATPRIRPAEFDTPSEEEENENKSTIPIGHIPTVASTPIVSIPSSTTITTPRKVSASTTAPASSPLKSASSNLSPTDKDALPAKDRHVSPSPLGTADSNVVGNKVMGASQTENAPALATKAIKRAATSGTASNGAEKRKKALKRL